MKINNDKGSKMMKIENRRLGDLTEKCIIPGIFFFF